MAKKRTPKKAKLAVSLITETAPGQALLRSRLAEINKELVAISRQARELEAERKQLQPLVNGSSSRKKRGRKARSGTRKRSRAVASERVVKAIKALQKKLDQPPTKSELAEQLGVKDNDRLTKPLKALHDEGTIERSGRARGTRYSLA